MHESHSFCNPLPERTIQLMSRMRTIDTSDTIAAISTPPGQGGLGIVRVSGPDALNIADKLFRSKGGVPSCLPSHTVHYGRVEAEGQIIDNVLLVIMRGPQTYTGDDTVEISCHGGRIVLHKTLAAAIHAGARPANPGEFTMRAFLNGKMDLSQAEAVQQLIGAENELAFRVASRQLRGKLHNAVEAIRSEILDVAAVVEASIDFPEDDIELCPRDELCTKLALAIQRIEKLLSTFEDGVKIVGGVSVVIAGKPNVGKSTLLNSLLEKDVAIVTPIAGTTRDLLRESLILQGITLNVYDTAGIRKPRGIVEREGVKRSKQAVQDADLVLFVLDADAGLSEEDTRIFREIGSRKHIVVINKIDLAACVDEEVLAGTFGEAPQVKTSALKAEGIEELKRRISDAVWSHDVPRADQAIITSIRHRDALGRAKAALHRGLKALRDGLSPEFPAVEIREALDALGLITGETTEEEILHRIFSTFCIGK